jgi:hypothetical protein
VTAPDFEVKAGLCASSLLVHVPPESATSHDDAVAIRRECVRNGLPKTQTAAAGHYEHVDVRTNVFGSVQLDMEEQ